MTKKVSLELFSGRGLVSQIMAAKGFSAISVDNNPKLNPSICCNILDLDVNSLPGCVSFFWASPDCRYFSRIGDSSHWKKTTIAYRRYNYEALTSQSRNAVALVEKTFQLIDLLNPGVWFIENPVGRFHHLEVTRSAGHYRYGVNYYDWGFPYSKETYIFTNQLLPLSTKKVIRNVPSVASVNNRQQRSAIPAALLHFLIEHSNL